MPLLIEIQRDFRRALLDGDAAALAAIIVEDDIAPAARIDVHRNNVVSSLTTALKGSFPTVCRLVDERFFNYAADVFVRTHPPTRPCLSEYGQDFPAFIESFAPCRHLAYLGDVARLEWLIQRALSAPDRPALQPSSLQHLSAADAPRLIFQLQQSHAYLASQWPIVRIWHANRPSAAADMQVDLESGGVQIEVRRCARDVEMRLLPADEFTFRARLSAHDTLAAAAEAALAVDATFDPAGALARLFSDGAVVAFKIADGAH